MRPILSIGVTVLILIGGVAVVHAVALRRPTVVQPVQFNHSVHVNEAGMQCINCHTDAETSVYAGLPRKEVCFDCHDIDEESETHPEKDKLFAYAETDDDIPWTRVAVTRPDVFFSHRRHVRAANIDCLECHTDQATLTAPPTTTRLVFRMNGCLDCHRKCGAGTDCLNCHR